MNLPVPVNRLSIVSKKTKEKDGLKQQKNKNVTVRVDGVPFSQAMSILTQETSIPIMWPKKLDETTASGDGQVGVEGGRFIDTGFKGLLYRLLAA
jgi:hypothetical protein